VVKALDGTASSVKITIKGTNDAPVVGTATVTLSEEGLPGANPDNVGNPDTTNTVTASGTLSISDADSSSWTVTLLQPADHFTSGGQPLQWSGSGSSSSPLIGSVGGRTILTATIDDGGRYSVTLSGPIDHPDRSSEDVHTVPLRVQVSDGAGGVSFGTLNVRIEDDSAVFTAAPEAASVMRGDGATFVGNLNLNFGADAGPTKALAFSGGAGVDAQGFITATHTAENGQQVTQHLLYQGMKLSYVAGRTPGSLVAVATDGTQVYTVTPDTASGTYGVTMLRPLDATVYTASIFGDIKGGNTGTYSYGDVNNRFVMTVVGKDAQGQTASVNTNNGYFGVANNFIDHRETLTFNFSTNMKAVTLKIDGLSAGETLHYRMLDANGNEVRSSSIAGSGSNGSEQEALLPTGKDFSQLVIAGGSSSSFRVGLVSVSGESSEVPQSTPLSVTGRDADGDAASSTVSLTFTPRNEIIGGTGNDTINGTSSSDWIHGGTGNDTINAGAGNDVVVGGSGSDVLTGGAGSDVFKWNFGDGGTASAPAIDRITDFDNSTGGDKLDLRDLLVNENGSNLNSYLNFTFDRSANATKLEVSTAGNGTVDQVIMFSNVDLVSGFSNNSQIINDLISRGKLLVDGSV
ncbi:type I secretion C-terminal target domain-containing protein, partial [Caldimonas tepidiphila]|uniref:type I secretion C-terminal target domain-containing protein n=1 Tax=Caldimonas tepidiphila TaxID=2315841 RepID=UPI000E5A3FDC